MKTTLGVGFNSGAYRSDAHQVREMIGQGKYKQTLPHNAWYRMMVRCYDPKYHEKKPTYSDCFVNEEWYDFQDFAPWFKDRQIPGVSLQLDKDFLVKGNREYSSKNCVLLPNEINCFYARPNPQVNGLPPNVSFRGKKFETYCSNPFGKNYIGVFETPELAFEAYDYSKQEIAQMLAEKWKGLLDSRIIAKLIDTGELRDSIQVKVEGR